MDTIEWNDIIIHGGKDEYGQQLEAYYDAMFGLHAHQTGAAIRKVVGEELWNRYFVFSFVRNPYDRVGSMFSFVKKAIENTPRDEWNVAPWYNWLLFRAYMKNPNFSDFIRSDEFRQDHNSREQVSYLMDSGEWQVDWIGRTENMAEDFAHVSRRIGLGSRDVRKVNSSGGGKYIEWYSDADVAYINQVYANDFKYLPYEKEG